MDLKMDANPMSSNLVNIMSTEPEVFLRDLYSLMLYIALASVLFIKICTLYYNTELSLAGVLGVL